MIIDGMPLMLVIWCMSWRLVLRCPQFHVRQVIGSIYVECWVYVDTWGGGGCGYDWDDVWGEAMHWF